MDDLNINQMRDYWQILNDVFKWEIIEHIVKNLFVQNWVYSWINGNVLALNVMNYFTTRRIGKTPAMHFDLNV